MDIKKELIYEIGSQPFAEAHASTLVQLEDGSYFVAWFGGAKEKNPDVAIWGARKVGEQWSGPIRLARAEEMAHWNPVLHCQDGIVYLFFKVGVDVYTWKTYMVTSADSGDSWSQPKELVAGDIGGRGPVKNKLIVLSNGDWLAPNSIETATDWDACVDRSCDKGMTWTQTSLIPLCDELAVQKNPETRIIGVIQPTMWESEPGHVHMLLRSPFGVICRSDSSDFGNTWSAVYPTELPNNNSGIDLAKLTDGTLALLYNPVGQNWGVRSPLVLSFSTDNGKTWPVTVAIEEQEGEFSYPAIIANNDGLAFSYTYKRKSVAFGEIANDQIKPLLSGKW